MGFALIQLVPYRVDNPKARDEPAWDSPATRALAVRSCFACHSNETKVAAFEQVAPIKWYIANHVKDGRAALNFSEWHTAAGEGAHDAAEPIGDGMPPSYFTYFGMHQDSKLTPGRGPTVRSTDSTRRSPPTSEGRPLTSDARDVRRPAERGDRTAVRWPVWARMGATVRARMPSVARSAPSEMIGKMSGLLPLRVDVGPVVVGGHERAVVGRLEPVAVHVADRRLDLAEDRPGDLAVRLEGRDLTVTS